MDTPLGLLLPQSTEFRFPPNHPFGHLVMVVVVVVIRVMLVLVLVLVLVVVASKWK